MMVHFTLIGEDYNPDYVTRRTDIAPCRAIHGDIPFDGASAPLSDWSIHTETVSSFELSPLLAQFSDLLLGSGELLREIAESCGAKWHIVFSISIRDMEPSAIILPPEFFRFCGEIGADLDIRTQILS